MSATDIVRLARGKDPMHGLCESRQITPEACDWVKLAVDPFHDLQLDNLKGYPDLSTEPTVVVKVRQAIEISAPTTLAPGTNWDCHIVLSPIDWAKPNGTGVGGVDGYNRIARSSPQGSTVPPEIGAGVYSLGAGEGLQETARLDGLLINSVPAGSGLGPESDKTFTPQHCPTVDAGGYHLQNINLDKYLDYDETDLGVYRLVYSGFEVVNTTAQISKQGACTVYEYGQSYEMATCRSGDFSEERSYPVNYFRSPPNTIAEAKIMPGAHTWAAQEGAYCVSKFQTENPFQAATQRNYIINQNNATAGPTSGYGQGTGGFTQGSFASFGIDNSNYEHTPASHFSRMNTTGAYFTGLSPETTLFVTWRVGIERLPAANKPTFLALASPSAAFDPAAIVLYNLICQHLPPGVPQGYNDAGKWFQMIANVARRVIPKAFPLVGAAQAILTSLGHVNTAKTVGMMGEAALSAATRANARNTAAQKLQKAARGRNGSGGQKKATPNFGAPGAKTRGVQSFSQMA